MHRKNHKKRVKPGYISVWDVLENTFRELQRLAEMEDGEIMVAHIVIELRVLGHSAHFDCQLSVMNILVVISHPGGHVANIEL